MGIHRVSSMLSDGFDRIFNEKSRDNLQLLSTILRQSYGEDTLAKVMYHDAINDKHEIVLIDGVRRITDIETLMKVPEFKLVYIETDIEKRYERIKVRGENPDDGTKSFEEFVAANSNESELQIKELKNYANVIVDNNGSYDDFYQQVEKLLEV